MTQAPPLLTPFVGREREQDLYRQFLTWTTPWVMVITGKPGIGKSTLLQRLIVSSQYFGERRVCLRGEACRRRPTRERPCRLVGIGVGSQVEGI